MLSFFCDIRDKSAIFNILRQNMTIFDIGNLIEREEIKRKWGNVKSKSLFISSFSPHFLILFPFPHSLSISSFSLHFLAARLPGCNKLCNPDPSYAIALVKKFCLLLKNSRKTLLDTKCFRTICISAMYCIIQALWLYHTIPVSKLLTTSRGTFIWNIDCTD